jgi:aminoglycoside phosphotransferase (APT) family kinase protein
VAGSAARVGGSQHPLVPIVPLADWMEQEGLGAGPIEDVAPLLGGTQNILLRFRRGDRCFVLRRPPRHASDSGADTMRREAQLLVALAATDVPHPALIASCASDAVIGAPFYLMEEVAGFNATNGLPPLHAHSADLRRRMGFALVEAIARLACVDYRAVGLDGFGNPAGYLERQVGRWRAQLDGYARLANWPGEDSLPDVKRLADWLDTNRPPSFLPGIMHGDYHLANVMFRYDGPEIAAIVDWELATIGDPLIDLGWVMATWPDADGISPTGTSVEPWQGFPRSDELVGFYEATTGRAHQAPLWYAVLACYKLGILLEGTQARACAGMAVRETGERLHVAAVRLFERAHLWLG